MNKMVLVIDKLDFSNGLYKFDNKQMKEIFNVATSKNDA